MAEYTVHAKKSLIIKAAISKSKIHVSEKRIDEVCPWTVHYMTDLIVLPYRVCEHIHML